MLNSVHLAGRIGKDPELRELGGKPFCSLRLATDGYKGATDWFDVVCWGKVAEAVAAHLSKGSRVFVDGRLQTRSWKGDDGRKRTRTEIVARTVTFLGGGRSDSDREARPDDKAPEDYSDSELGIDPDYDFDEEDAPEVSF